MMLKTGIVAVLAAAWTTTALAGPAVLEFEGFSITFEGSGQWNAPGDRTYDRSGLLANHMEDALGGAAITKEGGVMVNEGYATFGGANAFALQSYAGQGKDASHATFSYTVQAKPGWELSTVYARQAQSGTYFDFLGGTTSMSGAGTASASGGAFTYAESAMSKTPDSPAGSATTGTWSLAYAETAQGNGTTSVSIPVYDGKGRVTGYSVSYVVAGSYATPLTAMTGSFNEELFASTTDCAQFAYASATGGAFTVGATAVRNISVVPEPEPYVMLAASLAVIGFAARRKQKKGRQA
jgi:hypothetical protein